MGPMRMVAAAFVTAWTGAVVTAAVVASCQPEAGVSPCHEMRRCITLTCRELADQPERWDACTDFCQRRFDVPQGEHALCARTIGRLCVTHPWEGAECVAGRQRCLTGHYIEPGKEC